MVTYSYDIMVKANPDWLRQVTDDLILNGYFNNIIKNPEVLGTVLKDKKKRAFQSKPLLRQRRVRVRVHVRCGADTWNKELFWKNVQMTLSVVLAACFRTGGIWTVMAGSADASCVSWKLKQTNKSDIETRGKWALGDSHRQPSRL